MARGNGRPTGENGEIEEDRWRLGDLIIAAGSQKIFRNSEIIELPQRSFRFLMALIRAAPNVLSVDDLMEQVWPGIFVNPETVTQRAKLLRDALGDDPRNPKYFSVRRGIGYQLIATPVPLGRTTSFAETAARWRGALAAFAAILLLMVAATGFMHWRDEARTSTASVRIAVLPFDNLSNNPADAFIARSIPEIVLNRLSSVKGLTVISRESSMLSIAAHAAPADAGAELNAAYVVKGSVQRSGNMLRVTCFVVDVAHDTRLWSEYFDWPIDRIYALQDRIADHVAASLDAKVRGLGALPPAPQSTRNTDAYLAYLKGTSLLGRFTVADTDAAATQFARAVQLDPTFAQALVALYDARMQGADLRKDDLEVPRKHYQPLIEKAMKLEPDSGPALFALATWSDRPVAERMELFERAAERDPSNSRGLTAYAGFLDRVLEARTNSAAESPDIGGQSAEAKALLDRVLTIDPLSPRARFWAIQRRWTSATPAQIERDQARELELDPQNYLIASRYGFRRWFVFGQTADAIEKIERVIAMDPQNPTGANIAMAAYLDAGDPEAARAVSETTNATRASSRILLGQYVGDWRGAGEAAFGNGGQLFNIYQTWNWPQAIRDYALETHDYDRAALAIARRFKFDLADPRTANVAQANAATALAHILLVAGKRDAANRLLASTVQWIDAHSNYGPAVHMRIRATAMMLLGSRNAALSNLRASVESGHDIRHWWYLVDHDPVWLPVRGDPRFQAIAQACRNAAQVQRAKLDALRREGKVPIRTPDRSS